VDSAADPAQSLISVFQTGAVTFLSSSSSFILTMAEWTPFQIHCYSENLAALGIEPGTSGSAARKSDHRCILILNYRISMCFLSGLVLISNQNLS
jgi:hypothetical protein